MNYLSQGRPKTLGDAIAYQYWLKQNKVQDSPYSDYDNYGAFKAGINRDPLSQHFPDTFKLPWHSSFSNQSKYYKKGMPAVYWDNNGQAQPII